MASIPSRRSQRNGFDVPVRLSLLEDDIDRVESTQSELREELKTIRMTLIGILISLCTGCVLFTLNIIVGALKV